MSPTIPSTSAVASRDLHVVAETRDGAHGLDHKDFAMVGLLLVVLAAMFWRVIFTSDMFFYRDVFNYSYPHAQFIQELCRRGQLPYWNPYLNYGEPVLANLNFLFFYPYTLLTLWLPIGFAYCMHYVLHFALSAVGCYWLARRWEQSRAAAFFAASFFTLSGPVLSLGNFYNHAACVAWIPWALVATDYAIDYGLDDGFSRRSRRPWILLTVVFALQFLAAEPLTLIATFGLCFSYALFRKGRVRQPLAEPNRKIVGTFILVGLLMVTLSAAAFLPSVDLLHNARRGTEGLPFNETAYWSFHPLLLLEMVIPSFFGQVFEAPTLWTFILNCRNSPYFPSVFLGFVPLFLALVGWALGRNSRRNFTAVAALAFLLLSLGKFTPVFALTYLLLPPLELVRFPVKLLIPAVLLTALLAGWGFDTLRGWQSGSHCGLDRVTSFLKCLLALVISTWLISWLAPGWIARAAGWVLQGTNGMFSHGAATEKLTADACAGAAQFLIAMVKFRFPGLAGFVLGGLVWVLYLKNGRDWARKATLAVALFGLADLAVANYSANPTTPKSFYSYLPPVVSFLRDSQLYRAAYVFRRRLAQASGPDAAAFLDFSSIPEIAGFSLAAQASFHDRLLLMRGPMLAGVETSLNNDVERSFPPFLYDLWLFLGRQIPEGVRTSCLLARTNIKYQIFREQQHDASLQRITEVFNGSAEPSFLYESLYTLPRAYVAGSAFYSSSALETLTCLSDPRFDARGSVILEGQNPGGVGGSPKSSREPLDHCRFSSQPPQRGEGRLTGQPASGVRSADLEASAGSVQVVGRQTNTVELRAEVSRPGYVVLLDRFDPNWHATVDGQEVTVLRANHLFRGVRVEPGSHTIGFYYRQKGLKAGVLLSLSTLAVLVALYVADGLTRENG